MVRPRIPSRFVYERRANLTKFGNSGEFLVNGNTIEEKLLHIILHDSDGKPSIWGYSIVDFMLATQVQANLFHFAKSNPRLNKLPPFGHVLLRPCHLEIVNIDDQEQLQFWVPIAAAPFLDRGETNPEEVILTVSFPITPRVRMPVKSEAQGDNRVIKTLVDP